MILVNFAESLTPLPEFGRTMTLNFLDFTLAPQTCSLTASHSNCADVVMFSTDSIDVSM